MEYKKTNVEVKGIMFDALEVKLPKTTLLVISNENAYFMCGALDVKIFNEEHLKDRHVICGKCVGVKTIDELLNAPLKEVSDCARNMGVFEGMLVKDALLVTY